MAELEARRLATWLNSGRTPSSARRAAGFRCPCTTGRRLELRSLSRCPHYQVDRRAARPSHPVREVYPREVVETSPAPSGVAA
ncbi:hypothetical protein ACIO5Z_20565 [Streptomyces rochei]|uniref:hypothetical protein n=1 Tax=Streptomyces rochei TaxID=1928 RepID=UPI0037FB06EE